ncbi:Crp/Fnr family transcriptional regulator [Streptomyces scopuliridis]|uniref:Crp/Fnr family transcriptional regulator n=1 Tax=Streptomyces scopuliridis TaxID=452529 RepID=UPI003697AE1E
MRDDRGTSCRRPTCRKVRGWTTECPFPARLEREDRAHEPSTHVLLILNGWTKVTASAANGYEALLALRGPGDIITESAALTGRVRSATVTPLEPVEAVAVEHDRFRELLAATSQVALRLLGLTADRTRAADRRRLEFASMSVRERFAALLLDLARTHGRRALLILRPDVLRQIARPGPTAP